MSNITLLQGDCIQTMRTLPSGSVQCCVTSPPYFGLRDYGHEGQIGLEETPDAYVAKLVDVFREVRRLLRDDGTLWLNLGDSYFSPTKGDNRTPEQLWRTSSLTTSGGKMPKMDNPASYNSGMRGKVKLSGEGLKPKDLIGIPWMVAFALRADGWYLRSDIIWHKPNPMPESVTDRPTKAHEYIFLLSKSQRYYYDADAVREANADPDRTSFARGQKIDASRNDADANTRFANMTANGRNRRSVWTVTTKPYKGAHFATFPPALIEPCILAGSAVGDTVLDPFNGSGTTGAVSVKHGRNYIGCELNPDYIALAHERIAKAQPALLEVA